MNRPGIAYSRIRLITGLVLCCGFALQCQQALSDRSDSAAKPITVPQVIAPQAGEAYAAPPQPATQPASLTARAARDPLGFLQAALDHYDRSVRDYTCTFSKQERLGGQLTPEQVIAVSFREKPFSVRMEWKQNPDRAARVLYVADRWIEKGQRMALVEPSGAVARLLVSYVMRPIDGEEARKSSRRTIDLFGVRNTLVLTLKYANLTREKGLLDLTFKGESELAGRPTLVFERHLPYTGEDGPWPDRVQVLHLDRETLLPALSASYADDDQKILLGRYQWSDVKLNPTLPDSVFTKEGMGF